MAKTKITHTKKNVKKMEVESKGNRLSEVRFRVLEGSKTHEAVLFFEKNYGMSTKSKTIQLVLTDFKILHDFFSVRTFEGLIKKIGIKVAT